MTTDEKLEYLIEQIGIMDDAIANEAPDLAWRKLLEVRERFTQE